ncbi:MAG: DUF2088 domain-containing protein [Desulfovibrionales bacterium]|nr:MAG: DUF2088 domain-containing protein [Desulfovibrionales bacterium]
MIHLDNPTVHALLSGIAFPDMALVRQRLERSFLQDIPLTVAEEAARVGLNSRVQPGQSVAIAVGSRGIDRLAQVIRSLCDLLHGLGARPFILSAMGSHGGATPEGQSQVLAGLGVTEQAMGAPLRIGMATTRLGTSDLGMPVLLDSLAAKADHLIVVNRIKAHTKFKARVESGLMKMLAVGLGNDQSARLVHKLAPSHGMFALINAASRVILERGNLLCGVGLVENGLGRLHTLRLLLPGDILEHEPLLLTLAKRLAPKLPFDELDVLVVDEIGKDISGTGMDTNVTGRNRDILGDFTATPRIKRIFVRDLSPGTAGNALGIGFADVTTDRVIRKQDYAKTAINALTGLSPEKAALPLHLPTDRLALAATLHTLGAIAPNKLRMARIKNTNSLEYLQVSTALLDTAQTDLKILHSLRAMAFTGEDLSPFPEPDRT